MSLATQRLRTLANIDTLHPLIRERAGRHVVAAHEIGIELLVHQALRDWETQDGLYEKGRSVPGEMCRHGGHSVAVRLCPMHPLGLTVTNARAGDSFHNYGLAYDATPMDADGTPLWMDDALMDQVIDIGRKLGLECGADWRKPDRPHFHLAGVSLRVLKAAAPDGHLPPLWLPPVKLEMA